MKFRGIESIERVMKGASKEQMAVMLIDAWNYIDMEHDILTELFGSTTTDNIVMDVTKRLTAMTLKDLGAKDEEIEEIMKEMEEDEDDTI